MKIAESYWCLFSASWRQSLKNFSIMGLEAFVEQPQGYESDSIEGEKWAAPISRLELFVDF
jgi:hypothetical protein